MSQEHAFLRAIIEDPDTDSHRLVYTDWLDDTEVTENRDRAEFIRVQCQLARLPDDTPERPNLTERERVLLKMYAKR